MISVFGMILIRKDDSRDRVEETEGLVLGLQFFFDNGFEGLQYHSPIEWNSLLFTVSFIGYVIILTHIVSFPITEINTFNTHMPNNEWEFINHAKCVAMNSLFVTETFYPN